jgi:hypothetical protein
MRGIAGMGFSAVAIVAGAILRYAVTVHQPDFNFSTAGTILMIAGAIGFVVSTALFLLTRNQHSAGALARPPAESQRTATAALEAPQGPSAQSV